MSSVYRSRGTVETAATNVGDPGTPRVVVRPGSATGARARLLDPDGTRAHATPGDEWLDFSARDLARIVRTVARRRVPQEAGDCGESRGVHQPEIDGDAALARRTQDPERELPLALDPDVPEREIHSPQ